MSALCKHIAACGVATFLLLAMFGLAAPALAAPPSAPAASSGGEVCTTFQQRLTNPSASSSSAALGAPNGILTEIYVFIKKVVDDATKKIFSTFINSPNYKNAVYWTMVLSVIIFGVLFTIGVVQPTAGQVVVRLIKFGVIIAVVGPGGWEFFSTTVVRFFNDGTDDLVRSIIGIATGQPPAPGSSPFAQLDQIGAFMIHPDQLKLILGALTSGPYGMGMAALMGIGFGAFLKMLIDALRLYAVAYVVRSLMLGLAPIFIVFLLFEKTKQLFMVWLNTLVSTMLQPVLMFIFLAFFIGMINDASRNLFGQIELCWSEFEVASGSTNKFSNYRFKGPDGQIITEQMTFFGTISCKLQGRNDCPEYPVKIIDLLTFLLLVFLASRFAEVVDRIANELSGTFIALDPQGKMDQLIANQMQNSPAPAKASSGGAPPPKQK
jgi:type IV secretory pathway VirB6-like protein